MKTNYTRWLSYSIVTVLTLNLMLWCESLYASKQEQCKAIMLAIEAMLAQIEDPNLKEEATDALTAAKKLQDEAKRKNDEAQAEQKYAECLKNLSHIAAALKIDVTDK